MSSTKNAGLVRKPHPQRLDKEWQKETFETRNGAVCNPSIEFCAMHLFETQCELGAMPLTLIDRAVAVESKHVRELFGRNAREQKFRLTSQYHLDIPKRLYEVTFERFSTAFFEQTRRERNRSSCGRLLWSPLLEECGPHTPSCFPEEDGEQDEDEDEEMRPFSGEVDQKSVKDMEKHRGEQDQQDDHDEQKNREKTSRTAARLMAPGNVNPREALLDLQEKSDLGTSSSKTAQSSSSSSHRSPRSPLALEGLASPMKSDVEPARSTGGKNYPGKTSQQERRGGSGLGRPSSNKGKVATAESLIQRARKRAERAESLILAALTYDPEKRIAMNDVLRHPFFEDEDTTWLKSCLVPFGGMDGHDNINMMEDEESVDEELFISTT
ncbi:unnamed protein product [Amoebophrya sp. A25]|nr:unnamed protein product [Amoebophrya sp. A25]|eukprot:GSA25T00025463001.1